MSKSWIVTLMLCSGFTLAMAASVWAASESRTSGPVQVEILENLVAGKELEPPAQEPTERYAEPAFAFLRTPIKYSKNAVPLDRSTPFVLRATYERDFAAGEYSFRLRARGAAVFMIDGVPLLRTKAQPPNTTGDDPVPPPVVHGDSPLRPLSYPHQDAIVTLPLAGGSHRFMLVAIIGGKGLAPTPGELAVSFGRPGEIERLLGPDGSAQLTDVDWEAYVAASAERHRIADIERRRGLSEQTVAAWRQRHERVRDWLRSQPAPIVPKVSPSTPVYNDIDRFLGAKLEAAKRAPTEMTSDLEFLRRVSLDAIGLIPTSDEVRAYLKDPSATRRKDAIERLLNDPSWADHWVSYWQDVLAENPGIVKPNLNNTGPFRWWLYQSFTDGLPMDRIVTELVEMEGSAIEGGPAAFGQATLNDAPMATKASIIVQAFLGEKLECARCHDAPFHPFTQRDLFSIAAMLNGKELELPATSTVPMVAGARTPLVQVTLKPGESIGPQWPFKDLIAHSDSGAIPASGAVPSRRDLAALVVSTENRRFAQVIANRLWKRYMGLGLVEPVDDWTQGGKPSHPELLDYLAREFVMSGYDMKSVARLILSSHAYQRRAALEPTQLFEGPARRRMTAEQLVDSLHRSVGKRFDCEELNLNAAGDRTPRQFLNMGTPTRAWQLTGLSNERDRPALALPIAQSTVDVMTTFGWRPSRQNPATTRDDAPSPMRR